MNPIVAAHTAGETPQTSLYSHVQLFDALLWACKNDDVDLLAYLQTTPLDIKVANALPLITAIEHNSVNMGQALAPLFKEHIFKAVKSFVFSRTPNTLSDPIQRKRWLNILLPHSSYDAIAHQNITPEKMDTYGDLAYVVAHLSVEDLDLIPQNASQDAQKNAQFLFHLGMMWAYVLKHTQLGLTDPVEKTQWFVNTFPDTNQAAQEELFKSAYENKCFGSARIINAFNPKLFIPCKILHDILTHNSLHECLQALAVQPAPYSQADLKVLLKNVAEEHYTIGLITCSAETDKLVIQALLPYIQKASTEIQTAFWERCEKNASSTTIAHLEQLRLDGVSLPHFNWGRNTRSVNFRGDLSLDTNLPPSPLDCTTLSKHACLNSVFFDWPSTHLCEPDVFKAIVDSGNIALIEKALECGAQIDMPMFNQIANINAQACDRIFQKYVRSNVALPDILNNWRGDWSALLFSHNPEPFYQDEVFEQLHVYKVTHLVNCAMKNQRLDLMERALLFGNVTSSDVWTACARLTDTPFIQQVVECLLNHLDPWLDNCKALGIAVENNNLPMVERLVEVCDPRADNSEALLIAASQGLYEMVEFLLKHCPAQSQDWGALRSALTHQNKDLVLLLLRQGPVSERWAKNLQGTKNIELLNECQNSIQAEKLQREVGDVGLEKKNRII